jgi:hypothetical protein
LTVRYNAARELEYRRLSVTDQLVRRLMPRVQRDYIAEARQRRQLHFVNMAVLFLISGASLFLLYTFFRDSFPIAAGKYLVLPHHWADVLRSSWPIFAYAVGFTLFGALLTRNDPDLNRSIGSVTGNYLVVSAQAGLFEEINFRWLRFYIAMPFLKLFNWLLFGWGHHMGWVRISNEQVWLPLANWATLHKLSEYLTVSDAQWIVPAAILAANAHFRSGHKIKADNPMLQDKTPGQRLAISIFPLINSWYLGMYFFFIMFHYGLLAAIVVHAVYDALIFSVGYIDAKLEH